MCYCAVLNAIEVQFSRAERAISNTDDIRGSLCSFIAFNSPQNQLLNEKPSALEALIRDVQSSDELIDHYSINYLIDH